MNAPLRIAVADDELDMRDYFAKCLARLGHEVVALANDGRELVELCRSTQPDLVITDVRMPFLNGIEAAKQINDERRIPVILVSAHHVAETPPLANGGQLVTYFLVKPIKLADLERTIAQAVERLEERRS